jgi:CcmD family protein
MVSLDAVAATTDKVQVAGVVDHSSLVTDKVGGESRFTFQLSGPGGTSLQVMAAGRPPFGFERTSTAVVEGRWRDGAFRASSVLIPGTNRGLFGVMAITMIVWLGLFAYVFWVDRRLTGLQRSLANHQSS